MLGRGATGALLAMPAPGFEQDCAQAADRRRLASIIRHEQRLAFDKWRSFA
jgi:hypothetical protein